MVVRPSGEEATADAIRAIVSMVSQTTTKKPTTTNSELKMSGPSESSEMSQSFNCADIEEVHVPTS